MGRFFQVRADRKFLSVRIRFRDSRPDRPPIPNRLRRYRHVQTGDLVPFPHSAKVGVPMGPAICFLKHKDCKRASEAPTYTETGFSFLPHRQCPSFFPSLSSNDPRARLAHASSTTHNAFERPFSCATNPRSGGKNSSPL